MKLISPAFAANEEIPTLYTCQGENISPPLRWEDVPPHAKSLVLIVEDPDAPDPDAPKTLWIHWLLYNLDPTITGLAENVLPQDLPGGAQQGINSWGKESYGGPCPPIGRHRYFHRLYALNTPLTLLSNPTADGIKKAMSGHVIEEAILIGTYQKK